MNLKKKFIALIIWTAIVVLFIALLSQLHIWEDGSWAFGSFPYPISGCLPWGICN